METQSAHQSSYHASSPWGLNEFLLKCLVETRNSSYWCYVVVVLFLGPVTYSSSWETSVGRWTPLRSCHIVARYGYYWKIFLSNRFDEIDFHDSQWRGEMDYVGDRRGTGSDSEHRVPFRGQHCLWTCWKHRFSGPWIKDSGHRNQHCVFTSPSNNVAATGQE